MKDQCPTIYLIFKICNIFLLIYSNQIYSIRYYFLSFDCLQIHKLLLDHRLKMFGWENYLIKQINYLIDLILFNLFHPQNCH